MNVGKSDDLDPFVIKGALQLMRALEKDGVFMILVNCSAASGESIVSNRVQGAWRRYQANKEILLAMPDMRHLLDRYDAAIENTQEIMRQAGVAAACGLCAEKTGSCCFQEVETWYDPMLLFINLLLSADLPRSRERPGQCLFLGRHGCLLRARYFFCLNYLCPTLRTRLGSSLMNTTLAAVGQELAAGWELERALYRWFKEKA